jgi:hypothetical protein
MVTFFEAFYQTGGELVAVVLPVLLTTSVPNLSTSCSSPFPISLPPLLLLSKKS